MSYILLIFGPHRIPLTVEALECATDEEATQRGRARAVLKDAFGYEIWTQGTRVTSHFSRAVIDDADSKRNGANDDAKPRGNGAGTR